MTNDEDLIKNWEYSVRIIVLWQWMETSKQNYKPLQRVTGDDAV